MPRIFKVSELTSAVKDVLESQFPFVWVQGQVGNVSRPASGHLYFSLKDEGAVLNVVWFKGSRRAVAPGGVDPLTGEVMEGGSGLDLKEGMDVLCAGRLNVYPPRGAYQLVAELVQEKGLGDLHLRFEALKRELAGRGWFDVSRKRPMPGNPRRVAVVTAPSGAAIRDFLRLASERGLPAEIRVFPALVQGEAAPSQLAEAVAEAGEWAEAVALIRGGGSLEDLWAFNTEEVARAVHDCPVPVVVGVGHEVDTSIADYVADVRAATPSHAAQLLWPERLALVQKVDGLEIDLVRNFKSCLDGRERDLASLERALGWLSPQTRVTRWLERFGRAARDMVSAWERSADRRGMVLEREAGSLIRALGPERMAAREAVLDEAGLRLGAAAGNILRARESSLESARLRLVGLDPQAPLARGYSLVRVAGTGKFLRAASDVAPGDRLDIMTGRGDVPARVLDSRQDGE